MEVYEYTIEMLESIIKTQKLTIEDLRETLSIPRQHFKVVDKMLREET
jgi:hypothetical protein